MIRVLIADDHTLLRQGLHRILADDPALSVVGEATDGLEAVARATELAPDVVLMDVQMPGLNGIEATRRIRAACPAAQIIMLTVSDKDADLFGALKAGARGYLLKNAEAAQVLEAIHRVAHGEAFLPPILAARVLDEFAAPRLSDALTEREQMVLRLLAQGLGNKEIAARLALTENTVKTHVRHILEKLHLRSRTEAAAYAARTGLSSTDQEEG
jgi:DNA-binding NarL/FixJ family response regulator